MSTSKSYEKWNKESILKLALKYKTKNNFRKNHSNAYAAACRLGVLDEVCEHMSMVPTHRSTGYINSYKIAKKYTNKELFKMEQGGIYYEARRSGILDRICKHMREPRKWSKNKLHNLALKYNTKNDFRKKHGSAYATAHHRGILNEICGHMSQSQRVDFAYVYVYKNKNIAYVGISHDVKKRRKQHINGKNRLISNLCKNVDPIIISEKLNRKEAEKIEKETIIEYVNKGYTMLNTVHVKT